jgi:WD40 repeat protein
MLATGSWDKTARIWDVATGQESLSLKGHDNYVYGVAWSPDGKMLATGSLDKTVKVWDAATGQELQTLKGHTGPVNSVSWSPETRLE